LKLSAYHSAVLCLQTDCWCFLFIFFFCTYQPATQKWRHSTAKCCYGTNTVQCITCWKVNFQKFKITCLFVGSCEVRREGGGVGVGGGEWCYVSSRNL
jgi:hypothetical protein